jgi:hypothetical protein
MLEFLDAELFPADFDAAPVVYLQCDKTLTLSDLFIF